MQSLEIFLYPCGGIDKRRGAELIRKILDPVPGKKQMVTLVAEIASLPPAIVIMLIQRSP